MRLADVLREENIITELKSREKSELLEEMVSGFSGCFVGIEADQALKAVLDREKLGTTGIGHGVAVPHGKVKGLSEVLVFFGRSSRGVNFDSMDKLPVFLFFMIIVPESAVSAHLKILAGISHLLKNQDVRTRLMRASTRSEIYRIIAEAERKNSLH